MVEDVGVSPKTRLLRACKVPEGTQPAALTPGPEQGYPPTVTSAMVDGVPRRFLNHSESKWI